MGYRIDRLNLSLKENGLLWTAIYMFKRATNLNYFAKRLEVLEQKKKYPGWNSVNQNRLTWNNWNWNQLGEEWTKSDVWKNKLAEEIINKLIPEKSSVIEIGPGGGRWTEYLQEKSSSLNLVDISEKCLELCKERFADKTNISYNLIKEVKFIFAADNTIDFIFSYDVFVHIDKAQITEYLNEFARVLKPSGKIILHYSKIGDKFGEYRSRFTSENMNELIDNLNFKLVEEYDVETLDKSRGNFFEVIAIIEKK